MVLHESYLLPRFYNNLHAWNSSNLLYVLLDNTNVKLYRAHFFHHNLWQLLTRTSTFKQLSMAVVELTTITFTVKKLFLSLIISTQIFPGRLLDPRNLFSKSIGVTSFRYRLWVKPYRYVEFLLRQVVEISSWYKRSYSHNASSLLVHSKPL